MLPESFANDVMVHIITCNHSKIRMKDMWLDLKKRLDSEVKLDTGLDA